MSAKDEGGVEHKGYRFLAGLIGGGMIFLFTQGVMLMLPPEGNAILRQVIEVAGFLAAAYCPIRALHVDATKYAPLVK